MKTSFYLRHAAIIHGRELPAGALIGVLETPDGVDVDRAVLAIASGKATANKEPKAADPKPAAKAPEAK